MTCTKMSGVTMISSERPNRVRGSSRLCQRGSCTARRASVSGSAPRRRAPSEASIGLEDIADAPNSLQIAREFRVALDLASEPRHLHVDRAHIPAELRLLGEPLAANGRAGAPGERPEERRLGRGQVHGFIAAPELRTLEVEAEPAEPRLTRARAIDRGAREDIADAQHQFARLERLHQIVIGALLEAVYAVLRLGHGGEQQDGYAALRLQARRQLEAVLAGHHHVDDREVVL